MPGKILIIDPIVTNRVILKAQLVAEYFSVELAADLAAARQKMTTGLPDILLLSYESEEASGFKACKAIRTDPRIAHLPIVLLCRRMEDSFWENGYRLGIEEILPDMPDCQLLAARLAQMVRRKKVVEEQRTRQRTYADMGFAEDHICFPPQFPPPVTLDCTHALQAMSRASTCGIKVLLKQSFPGISIFNKPDKDSVIQVIDECQMGRAQALQHLCDMQLDRSKSKTAPKVLFVTDSPELKDHRRALELGADDFIKAPFSDAEMASRLRRLAWVHQMEAQAEQKVDDRLRMAMLDPMTGLYNRRYALQYLDNISKKRGAEARSITVMMLDLDNFKNINDSFGHQTGDAVICETAKRLTANLRNADLVARVGGEEFLVVLSDTPMQQASLIAKRMCAQINAKTFQPSKNQQPFNVSISIGVAFAPSNCFSATELIGHADRALYQSKGRGRNRVTVLPIAA